MSSVAERPARANPVGEYTATTIAANVRAGKLSAREVVEACLAKISDLDEAVHAWAWVDPEDSRSQADAVDARCERGDPLGAMAGVPVGVKDIFNTANMPTQMGSPIWSGFMPGNDARVVYSLRQEHAVIPGKTVTAEFAVHTPGPTVNPHHPEYSPGTSSSGSAASVASGMVPVALGTQTAGSTLRPASYCGVYGFKPSFGLIPRTGMLKTTDSLDTVGVFGRVVEDIALVFDAIRVRGQDYPISEAAIADPARRDRRGRNWRVGFLRGPKWEHAEPYARDALASLLDRLRALDGVDAGWVEDPASLGRAHVVHETIYDRTLAYYFKEEFKQGTLVSPTMYEIIERGNHITLDQYKTALDEQFAIATDLDRFLDDDMDVLLTLSTGGEAPKRLDASDRPDSCLVWTLCGVPALNLPMFAGPIGLPFGAQLAARRFADYRLLKFATWLRDRGVIPNAPYPEPSIVRSDGNMS